MYAEQLVLINSIQTDYISIKVDLQVTWWVPVFCVVLLCAILKLL